MKKIYLSLFLSLCLFYSIKAVPVPVPGFRPPAIPLIVSDPYFSVWVASDNLTDTWSSLWDGTTKAFTGMLRIDGNIYRFMGPSGLGGNIAPNAMEQISVTVYPTNTVFLFQAGGVQLTLTFTTPLLPSSLDLLSRPVTYLTYVVQSIDGNNHDVQIYYDNSAEIAVNTIDQLVNWGTNTTKGNLRDLYIGTSTQNILQNSGDRVGIDWGYFHVATDASDSSVSYSLNLANTLRSSFASTGNLPSSQFNGPLACNNGWPALSVVFNLGSVTSSPVEKSYWTTLYSNFDALLDQAWSDYSDLLTATYKFDTTTVTTMQQIGGNEYATLTALAYRQCVGGTKMTWNPTTNTPWYFMKEISSDGDVSTVDVVFPASPLFLYFNATLLGLQLLPIFAYANNETSNPYSLVWAPHHLGTWPIANIQTSQQENMPIEETANIILMVAAIAKYAPEFDTILKNPEYWALLQQWGDYLVSVLPDPGNQLCTDDFEGPTPHDANLAVKGILGIAAFGQLNALLGNQTAAKKYLMIADQYVQNWTALANPDNSDHYRLRYDQPGWSLKYNMVFQNILNLFVFPSSVMQNEIAYYLQNLHPYGIPLDVRSDYSKLDWQSWVAAQGSDTDFAVIINSIYQFAQYTPQRVPLSDWYYTTQPNQQGFQARTVVGGLYAKAVFA